tara:strand:- start:51 stop:440 length:390 start_codon:yes stop_codon:yes gene_type:complete
MKGNFNDAEKRAIRQLLGIQIADFQSMLDDHDRKLERIISLNNKGLTGVSIEEVDEHINKYIDILTPMQIDPDGIFDLEQDVQEALQEIAITYFITDIELELNDTLPFVTVLKKMLTVEEFNLNNHGSN